MAHRPRRSAAQWQSLVENQTRSSLSAAEFCRRHDLGYASFMQWRVRLARGETTRTVRAKSPPPPHFVELTGGDEAIVARRNSTVAEAGVGSLLIELDLGDGLQLRISRG